VGPLGPLGYATDINGATHECVLIDWLVDVTESRISREAWFDRRRHWCRNRRGTSDHR